MRDGIVDEIMKVVNDQVRTSNYDMVFDRSGFSAGTIVPVLIYSRDNFDFSDSVITKLNCGRPSATATPGASKSRLLRPIPGNDRPSGNRGFRQKAALSAEVAGGDSFRTGVSPVALDCDVTLLSELFASL